MQIILNIQASGQWKLQTLILMAGDVNILTVLHVQ